MSVSWWVEVALPLPYLYTDLLALLQEYTLFALPELLTSQAETCTPTTCRLSVAGNTVVQHNPPAHGAFSSEEPCNTAGGIIWQTLDGGRRAWSITYLPGCPHDFVELGWQLSAEGYNNLLDSATQFKLQLESLPSYPQNTLTMGTLHRSRHGVPLDAAQFSPFVFWRPAGKVVTIRRRIPQGRSVLPF
jgi:hypothetical protein